MWGEILQDAMIAINVVPLIVSLVIVLAVSVQARFKNRRQEAADE